MPIAYDEVPSNALVPLFWPEIRPAQQPYTSSLKMLLIGRAEEASLGPTNEPILISDEVISDRWGPGSQLSHMYETARMNGGPFIEIHAIAIPKDGSWVKATGTIKVNQAATRDGMMNFLIGGRGVGIVVRDGQTAADIANNLKQKINRQPRLSFSATIDPSHDSWVVLSCKWKGAEGNEIRIVADYNRSPGDLADRWCTIVQPAGGVGSPSFTGLFDTIHAQEFDVIVAASYAASGKIALYTTEMAERWSPGQQLYGHIWVGQDFASLSAATTYADTLNEPHVSVIPAQASPTPMWEWAAAWAAYACLHWANPPEISRPLQTLVLKNCLVPKSPTNWYDITERQALLEYGLCAWRVGPNNQPMIDRTVTLRKDNAWGSPDPSWRDTITMYQAMFFARFMRALITGTYPRSAFSSVPMNIQGFTSPLQIRMTLLQGYLYLQRQGLVENYDLFAAALVVEKSASDPNRCDVYMRPDLVNQLRVVAAAIETNLELTAAANVTARAEAA